MFSKPISNTQCPKCLGAVTYNGNYLCLECDWALPHPCNSSRLREWAVDAYRNLMYDRKDDVEPKALNPDYWK